MKQLSTILLLLCCLFTKAQKNDYIWISGYGSDENNSDSATLGWKFGHTVLDFNASPVIISYDSLGMDIDNTNTTISDNEGNLLFYTNGVWIANNLHEKIEGSDSLNAGWLMFDWDPTIMEWGYRSTQGIIALPSPQIRNQYLLVHSYVDSVPGTNGGSIHTTKILHTLLDTEQNFGLGKVLTKNEVLFEGLPGFELSAVRHGNGRDWWIVLQKRNTGCFESILYNGGFRKLQNNDCAGNIVVDGDNGASAFSPDGSKYAHVNYNDGNIRIFDFDRCNGNLENVAAISVERGLGVSFSPNSRFLYVSAAVVMLQYDTWAEDIAASVDTVGVYDGYYLNGYPIIQGIFKTSQLAPDGKIYITSGSAIDMYHVVNNPDEKGIACNFQQHSVKLPGIARNIPNYPNYRLGALPGSACDTLTSIKDIAEKEKLLKIFPNPAADVATIDYGYTDWSKGEATMEITNNLGQVVHSQALPMYSGFQRLDVANYASGAYTVYIKRKHTVVATGKLVKE